MAEKAFLAIDLGASSGRHVAGLLHGRRLRLAEVYRFENGPVKAGGHRYWDVLSQWSHLQAGLRAAADQFGEVGSIAVDTWGVDFGLLGANDELLGNPYHYRDSRTDGMLERAFAIVPREEIFAQTGVQFMQISTLYQLLALRLEQSPLLSCAKTLLMMPDLFHWLLTGIKANERTNATTTQCYDARRRDWAWPLLDRMGIPRELFGPISSPATLLGPLRTDVADDARLPRAQVVLPGSHDTASAVMAVPAEGAASMQPAWCYISSGTWSLMGVETSGPVINEQCLRLNFTNEGGVGDTNRLLKNIAGLWLAQECRRIWNQQGNSQSWDDLNRLSAAAPPLRFLINPDDPVFLAPADMAATICGFCRKKSQMMPQDQGAVLRTVFDSLALKYRLVLNWLEELTGGRIETIHIVGGGAQNEQLCQAAADACNRTVIAGPVEATAIGNVLAQAIAAGEIAGVDQAREVVRRSFEVVCYQPRQPAEWDEAFERFLKLL